MRDEHELHEEREHAGGAKLVAALIALLLLAALSLGLHYVHLGPIGTSVAFLIAAIKVIIVGLVFMELLESMAATRWVAMLTVMFVTLLCLGILGDVAFR